MDLPVEHDAFRTRRLSVRTATLWKGPRLLLDGVEVVGKRLKFQIRDDSGRERTALLKRLFLDPVPRLQIDVEAPIEVVPPLQWYEWAWMCLPLFLIVGGGALGGLVGGFAAFTSARIFRGDRGTLTKYALSALVSSAAVLAFIVGGTILQVAMAPN